MVSSLYLQQTKHNVTTTAHKAVAKGIKYKAHDGVHISSSNTFRKKLVFVHSTASSLIQPECLKGDVTLIGFSIK